jgi:hypothetical protein
MVHVTGQKRIDVIQKRIKKTIASSREKQNYVGYVHYDMYIQLLPHI